MKPTILDFKGHSVRIALDQNNEPLFCFPDVCKALDIKNAHVGRFDLNPKGLHFMYTLTKGGKQKLTFISEGNLYRIVLRSNKVEALEFQSWICEEILPSIRKTGSYTARQTAYEELSRLCMQEKVSKDKGSFHSHGMHRRKHEKHLNAKRINAFKLSLQLNFDDDMQGVTP